MAFDELLEATLPDGGPTRDAIDRLVEQKRAGAELDMGHRISVLTRFIDAELSTVRTRADALPVPRRAADDGLDAFFRRAVGVAIGSGPR